MGKEEVIVAGNAEQMETFFSVLHSMAGSTTDSALRVFITFFNTPTFLVALHF